MITSIYKNEDFFFFILAAARQGVHLSSFAYFLPEKRIHERKELDKHFGRRMKKVA